MDKDLKKNEYYMYRSDLKRFQRDHEYVAVMLSKSKEGIKNPVKVKFEVVK